MKTYTRIKSRTFYFFDKQRRFSPNYGRGVYSARGFRKNRASKRKFWRENLSGFSAPRSLQTAEEACPNDDAF